VKFKALARKATHRALQVRQHHRLSLSLALSVYDLALRMGIAVRFAAVPSLEGLYESSSRPIIVLSTLRPAGRQRFTCAHEIGHHVFGHGTRVDEILEPDQPNGFDPQEYMADRFAAALLMPKIAVEAAFARRGWRVKTATPEQFFIIAQSLGVGYTTLLTYAARTLNLISLEAATDLERKPLKEVRRLLAQFDVPFDVFVVDAHWGNRPVEVEVGDVVLLPPSADVHGAAIQHLRLPVEHFVAVSPGHALATGLKEGWAASILVSRRDYVVTVRYRHLDDPDNGG